jgi:thiosulfate/3-mercaptopyruvate sulfurtransferase
MTTAGPLISVDELSGMLGRPDLRIVDTRWYLGRPGAGRAAYEAGHLPGAIHLDLDSDLADPDGYGAPGRHPLPSPRAFAESMGAVGIGATDAIVAYDDVGGWVAARLWWMLDALGHPAVAVLDGGIGAWTAAGLPLSTDDHRWPRASLALASEWPAVISRDELRSRLGEVVLLDARGAPRYRGETEPVDPVAGHIPTAINAPIDGNLDADGRFLSPGELSARFRDLGADGSQGPVVTSCGSGTSALHHALAMRAAGLPDPILYVGSYSDWSRSGYPIATGPEPGDPPPG